jgi:predicted ABC-type sugar transport system permease subunit
MVVEAYRFPAGAKLKPDFIAAVVLEGTPEVNGEGAGTVTFPDGGMIVAASIR